MERYPLAYFAKRLDFLKCFFHFERNNLEFKDLKSPRQLRSIICRGRTNWGYLSKILHMLNQHKILRVLQLITYLQEAPHKSVQQLASFLDTTERTVYRYLDLLRECGFNLHKDAGQRFFIEKEDNDPISISSFIPLIV